MEERYMDLIEQDILEPIRPLLEKGVYKFTATGQLEAEYRMTSETPWIHIRQDTTRNCGIWHHVWFDFYKFIPSGCQKCWKVVIRHNTLEELFKVHDLLVSIDMPSKCGIEKRYTVHGLYGGYMYNDSKEEGLSCLENIRKMLPDGVNAFLKRGCTEFEHKFGDSKEWQVSAEQLALERRLEDLFMQAKQRTAQSDEIKRHVMANWVRFAFANGDKTVDKFISKPLYPPYETFEVTDDA